MNEKSRLIRRIQELDFALYELVLYLDTHPTCRRAMELMKEYRKKRDEFIAEYEKKYGDYIVTIEDVPMADRWKWIDNPWPWEKNFMEG